MKILWLLSLCILPLSSMAECVALDYQEMKDMKTPALTEEYCANNVKSNGYLAEAAREKTYAASLRTINESIFDMQRSRDAGVAADKAARLEESAQACKSQMARIVRVMTQAGGDDAAPSCGK